ncbi:hypothetical protein BD779DRAFT_627265 [Infundibulicybe gibba]|nr:hypothetical protein BD779DRAFT_627265 [Infundibulicybe gibba]
MSYPRRLRDSSAGFLHDCARLSPVHESFLSLVEQCVLGTRTGETLPSPTRPIPFYSDGLQWRGKAGVNGALMCAAFPSVTIETSYYWNNLIKFNQTAAFERTMIISRPAAHRSPLESMWSKMIASTSAPAKFWEPVRISAIQNLLGYVPRPERVDSDVHFTTGRGRRL